MRKFWPFFGVFLLLIAAGGRDAVDSWVDRTELPSLLTDTSVEVMDRNGSLLRAYTVDDGIWRLGASAEQVDQGFLKLLITYEDKRFFAHGGVDFRAMLRAGAQALLNGEIVSGGSTLTMQVARLLENSGTGAWSGKIRQVRLALALERQLSKKRILDLYLTHAPYGGNLEGIRAATLAWFGKEPTRLTDAEAALLVSLPQSPNSRRPDRFPQSALLARERVLERSLAAGVLSFEDVEAALSEPVPNRRRLFPQFAPHLADRAQAANPDALRHDLTVDLPLQNGLERLAKHVVADFGSKVSIALLVADHTSGEILASVGSAQFSAADRRQGFIDMTRAKRSPGSTLKPLVYGLSFDQGLVHPETVVRDAPVAFGTYKPRNFDGKFRGDVRVSEALALSLNIPVVMLTEEIGPANLMAGLRRSGSVPKLPGGQAGLAVALGGVGLNLEELVQLYAGIANKGKAVGLHWRVSHKPEPNQKIMSRSAAWHIGHILSGIAPPEGAPRNRLAYKTGTSYGHRDIWAIGFDGRHVAGVWIGRPDGTPMPGALGGDVAAPLLFDVFQHIKPDLDPLGPPPAETILLANAQLPEPLRRFRSRGAVFDISPDRLTVAFPPDGARLLDTGSGVTVKLKNGVQPFSVLANGVPVATGIRRHEVALPMVGRGASVLTVLDAEGQSDRVTIWLE
ncbi:penicillin-binding protein 1C [Shimia isoporae]|uniref:peptidoglycan glycosyltransferase n=1 Tax=Shimia isoporae TaxID=647720 RepID=A0A4R1NB95_9RHOB|nr:penicillin-binding protein 1C [Shimia isoporae]TCL01379.1 penicillin-binding protein 1C [Shimia isoporae]